MKNNVDILAIAAHPDDAEIGAGGTLLRHVAAGYSVAVVDLTRGELGSRGSADIREREAAAASRMLQLKARENLGLADGFFEHDQDSMLQVIRCIRRYRPKIVLANTPSDRHPDHGRASSLISDACYYSGLRRIETTDEGRDQEAWRPQSLYYFIQDYHHKPDFVVDISEWWEKKEELLRCFSSQFYDPLSSDPITPISGEDFFDFLKGRAIEMGRPAGFRYAEGFISARYPGIKDLHSLH